MVWRNMKVVSIKEPFASLIAKKKKKYETRSWKTNYRGEILIHASKTKYKSDNRIKYLESFIDPKPGFVLCKAVLKDCIYMDENFIDLVKKDEFEFLCGRYEIGRYAWLLDDIQEIEPFEAKGQLGLWNLEREKNNE